MADANKPEAEKAAEATPTTQTEAQTEKSDTLETAAPEKAVETAAAEASTDSAAATSKDEATTTPDAVQPSSAAAAATTGETTTATTTDEKAALDKETGIKTEDPAKPDSAASSVVADKKDEEKAKEVSATAPAAAPVKAKTPFDEFDAKLPELLKEVGHDEMWGVTLVSPASSHVPTAIVLQKFLNANDGDLSKAIDQFKGALKFRKEKKPLDLLKKTFSAHKFAGLGAVTVYPAKNGAVPEVITWNLYGNVKGKMDEVFVPLNESVITT